MITAVFMDHILEQIKPACNSARTSYNATTLFSNQHKK